MIQHSHWSSIVAALGLLASLGGCSSDDKDSDSSTDPVTAPNTPTAPGTSTPGTGTPGTSAPAASTDPLVVLTERSAPEGALHYLHVLPTWPADGKLDFGKSIELGEPGVAHVEGDQFFHWRGLSGRLQKLSIDDKLQVQNPAEISFVQLGVDSFDAEPIWVSSELAYMVDEDSRQVIQFNPAAMRIDGRTPIGPTLTRDGLNGQLQLGLAANERLFTTASWYDYKGKGVNAAIIAVFDQKNLASAPKLVEDARCTYTVATGVWEDDDYVYVASDAANAFAVLADAVAKTTTPQCVLRMRKDGDVFDPGYLVDLRKVTGSPAIRRTWPMADNKLLANLWSPSIDPATIIKPGDDGTFWDAKAWTYAVVDLAAGTSKLVEGMPFGKQDKMLQVDDQNYLQVFRDDKTSLLYRVNADASVVQVLDLPADANVQYLGRLKPAAAAK